MKNGVLLIVILLATLMVLSYTTTPAFSVTDSENYHVPRLIATNSTEALAAGSSQPYMAGWMEGSRFTVTKTRVTVSFPDTDLSVIQSDNWLAAGMFVTGWDTELNQTDYGYLTVLELNPMYGPDHVLFKAAIYQDYEGLIPGGPPPSSELLYVDCMSIGGVSPSIPFTLTASWDASTGFIGKPLKRDLHGHTLSNPSI